MIRKILFPNILFSGLILLISLVIQLIWPMWLHDYHFPTVGLITFLMTMSLGLLVWKRNESEKFIGLYMILFITRFLLIATLFLVFKLKNTPSLELLVINFFLVYLSYLVFEIKQLLSNLRANS